MRTIFIPTINAMNLEGRPFKGILYFGLMLTPDGPKVLEYNARFGDPETQVVLPRLKNDLLEIFDAIIDEKLETIDISWKQNCAVCVVMASGGYPENYVKGYEITGLDAIKSFEDIMAFHAGTKKENGKFYTNGGRVLGVTAVAEDIEKAREKAYEAVSTVHFKDAHYRKDIGIK
jgi:phosphoribosylamine--glycine ligase